MTPISYDSLRDAYLELVHFLLQSGDGIGHKELCNVGLIAGNATPDPLFPENEELTNKTLSYCHAMDTGFRLRRLYEDHNMRPVANPDGTVNSSYGFLIFGKQSLGKSQWNTGRAVTPWEWCELTLKRDQGSRDALLRFSLPHHQHFGSRDFPSLCHSVFRIRAGKLNMTTVSRADDLLELLWVLPWLASLQERMCKNLATHYTLSPGTFSFFSHSVRLEQKDTSAALALIDPTSVDRKEVA